MTPSPGLPEHASVPAEDARGPATREEEPLRVANLTSNPGRDPHPRDPDEQAGFNRLRRFFGAWR